MTTSPALTTMLALHPVVADVERLYPGGLELQLAQRDLTLVKLSVGDVDTAVGFLASGYATPSLHPSSVGFRQSALAPAYVNDIMDRSGLFLTRTSASLVASTDPGSFAIRKRTALALDDSTVLRAFDTVFGSVVNAFFEFKNGVVSGASVAQLGNDDVWEVVFNSDLQDKVSNLLRGVGLVPQLTAPTYWMAGTFNTTWATTPALFAAEFESRVRGGGAPVPHATARYVGVYIGRGGDKPAAELSHEFAIAVGADVSYGSGVMFYFPVEEYGPQFDDITLVYSKTGWAGAHTHSYCFSLRGPSLVQTLEQAAGRPRGGVYVGSERFTRGATATTSEVPALLTAATPSGMPVTSGQLWVSNTTSVSPFVRAQTGPIGLLIGPPPGMDFAAMGSAVCGSAEVEVLGHVLRVVDISMTAHTTLTRVGWAALTAYWTKGSGLYAGLSSEMSAKAMAAAGDLEGKSLACVSMAAPYPVPADVVDRLDLHQRYAEAMEAACMEDDFLDQPYDSASTKIWRDIDTYFRQTARSLHDVAALVDTVSFNSGLFVASEAISLVGVNLVVTAAPSGAVLTSTGSTFVDTTDGVLVGDLLVAGAPLVGELALLDYVFGAGYAAEIQKRKLAHHSVATAAAGHSDTSNNPFDHSGLASTIGGWPLLPFMSQQDAWKAAIYSEFMLKGATTQVSALLNEFKPNAVVARAAELAEAANPQSNASV